MSVNKVILLGNVGKDVETKHLDSGNQVSNFSLATSETYTPKGGEKQTITEWHNIVLWGKLSEVAEKYIKKGQQVYLEGSNKTRSYDDKDGNKRYVTEVVANKIELLGKKEAGEEKLPTYDSSLQKPNLPPSEMAANGDEGNDLPF